MVKKRELLHLLDRFIEEKSASWNHDDWLSLVEKVKVKKFSINEQELGDLLEKERDNYNAKKLGLHIISKSKIINNC
jgi:hypothetical protein